MLYLVLQHLEVKVFQAIRLISIIYLLAFLGAMLIIWLKWEPQAGIETTLWWVAEVVLAYLALRSLVGTIIVIGMGKEFKRFDNF